MNRREILKSLGIVSTHALFPSVLASFVSGCSSKRDGYTSVFFTQQEFNMVIEIIDLLIPATKTKSASEVNTQIFLDEVFQKCLTFEQQEFIKAGLASFVEQWTSTGSKQELLQRVDQQAFSGDDEVAWFKLIKQYTLIGFFTSQEGETSASQYVKIPGDYKGDIVADSNTLNYGKTALRYYL